MELPWTPPESKDGKGIEYFSRLIGLLKMTDNSKVLALKYRPQIFEDLIGQEVISEAIYNSIKSGKSPNAYLFTGIRGVGKQLLQG